MARFNQVDTVGEIKSRCNIVDVIGRVVPLKRAGSNYKGVCPFHNEKTPSFVVSETKQIFTCFGCGAKGDVIGFVEKYYNLDFKGAVEMLAKEYGIEISDSFGSKGSKDKDELLEINRQAAIFFYKSLREKANPGYSYMARRGITPEILNKFGIGYADDNWTSLTDHLTGMGYDKEKLLKLGLVSKKNDRYYDKFRGRVMFPIKNVAGKVIGFGGRIIGEGEPKYLNSQESSVFLKKDNLYGLDLARDTVLKEDSIVLVEGYMDVIGLYQAGIRNVSASLGTALTENQARLIKRYTKNVYLSYDADNAGQNAAMRGLDILYNEDCRVKVLKVTDGKDPDEFVKMHGRKAFADLMETALGYADYKISRLEGKFNLNDMQSRADYVHQIALILRSMKPVEAEAYLALMGNDARFSEISHAVMNEYNRTNSSEAPAQFRPKPKEETTQKVMSNEEKTLMKLMLTDHKYIRIPEDIKEFCFKDSLSQSLYNKILSVYEDGRLIDISRLRDIIDQEEDDCLQSVNNIVVSKQKMEKMYTDCINSIKKNVLLSKEAELLTRLSMAEGTASNEEIAEITRELMEVQARKLKL